MPENQDELKRLRGDNKNLRIALRASIADIVAEIDRLKAEDKDQHDPKTMRISRAVARSVSARLDRFREALEEIDRKHPRSLCGIIAHEALKPPELATPDENDPRPDIDALNTRIVQLETENKAHQFEIKYLKDTLHIRTKERDDYREALKKIVATYMAVDTASSVDDPTALLTRLREKAQAAKTSWDGIDDQYSRGVQYAFRTFRQITDELLDELSKPREPEPSQLERLRERVGRRYYAWRGVLGAGAENSRCAYEHVFLDIDEIEKSGKGATEMAIATEATQVHDALRKSIHDRFGTLRRHPERYDEIKIQVETLIDLADDLEWSAIVEHGTHELAKLRREQEAT